MKLGRLALVTLILAACIASSCFGAIAKPTMTLGPRVLTVSSSGQYRTVQSAVTAATSGTMVMVSPGVERTHTPKAGVTVVYLEDIADPSASEEIDLSCYPGGLIALRVDDINDAIDTASATLAIGGVNKSPRAYAAAYDVPLSLAAVPSWIGTAGKMTAATLKTAFWEGCEVDSHSATHLARPGTYAAAYAEIAGSKATLEALTLASSGPRDQVGIKAKGFVQPGTWGVYALAGNVAQGATSITITGGSSELIPQTGYLKFNVGSAEDPVKVPYTAFDAATGVITLAGPTDQAHAATSANDVMIYNDLSYFDGQGDMDSWLARLVKRHYEWAQGYTDTAAGAMRSGGMQRYFTSYNAYGGITDQATARAFVKKCARPGMRNCVLFHFATATLAAELTAFKCLVDAIVYYRDGGAEPFVVHPVTVSGLMLGKTGQASLDTGALVRPLSPCYDETFAGWTEGALALPFTEGNLTISQASGGALAATIESGNILRLTTTTPEGEYPVTSHARLTLKFDLPRDRQYIAQVEVDGDLATYAVEALYAYAFAGESVAGAHLYTAWAVTGAVPTSKGVLSFPFSIPAWSTGEGYLGLLIRNPAGVGNAVCVTDITRIRILPV